MNKINMRNFGLLSGMIIITMLITAPALADPGLFTGCLRTKQGTISNIQAGTLPISPCVKGDVVIGFYSQ